VQKGTIGVFLYLLVIAISIIRGSYGTVIMGLIWIMTVGIIFLLSFIITNFTIKDRPELHSMFNPNINEHIIMPIGLLVLSFIPEIIWFFWPTVGSMLISISDFFILAIILSSFPLGSIFAYTRYQVHTDGTIER